MKELKTIAQKARTNVNDRNKKALILLTQVFGNSVYFCDKGCAHIDIPKALRDLMKYAER